MVEQPNDGRRNPVQPVSDDDEETIVDTITDTTLDNIQNNITQMIQLHFVENHATSKIAALVNTMTPVVINVATYWNARCRTTWNSSRDGPAPIIVPTGTSQIAATTTTTTVPDHLRQTKRAFGKLFGFLSRYPSWHGAWIVAYHTTLDIQAATGIRYVDMLHLWVAAFAAFAPTNLEDNRARILTGTLPKLSNAAHRAIDILAGQNLMERDTNITPDELDDIRRIERYCLRYNGTYEDFNDTRVI